MTENCDKDFMEKKNIDILLLNVLKKTLIISFLLLNVLKN